MTALSITAANVVAGSGALTENGIAGATITAGQVVYKDSSTLQFALADADGAASLRAPYGIALNGASAGQPLAVLLSGLVTIGATMTAGSVYYLGDTPGAIVPVGDLNSGDYPTIIGIATSTSVLDVGIKSAGVAI